MTPEQVAEQVMRMTRLHDEAALLEQRVIVVGEALRRLAGLTMQLNDVVAEWTMLMGAAQTRAMDPETIEKVVAVIRQAGARPANSN